MIVRIIDGGDRVRVDVDCGMWGFSMPLDDFLGLLESDERVERRRRWERRKRRERRKRERQARKAQRKRR